MSVCGQSFNARNAFQFVKFYLVLLAPAMADSSSDASYVSFFLKIEQNFLAVDSTPAVETYNLT